GNNNFSDGRIRLDIGGAITLNGVLDLSGGTGGYLTMESGQSITLANDIILDATADDSVGGLVEIGAETGISLTGRVLARGKGGAGQASGDGGDVNLSVENGDILVSGNILVEGA